MAVGKACGGCRQVLCSLGVFLADLCRLGVFPAFCGAVGDLGLSADSGVAVGDLGLSEGSGVAVGDLGCRQVLVCLLGFFLGC